MVVDALGRWPERATSLGEVCGEVLARIHAVTIPVDPDRGWLRWSGLGSDDPFYQQLDAFARHDRLLHLDFHPLNVLTDGVRVTAVLDWYHGSRGTSSAGTSESANPRSSSSSMSSHRQPNWSVGRVLATFRMLLRQAGSGITSSGTRTPPPSRC